MIRLSKLIIIRGNSGSGKTTLAKEIHNQLPRNTLLIPQDTVRRDMLRVKDGKNTLGLPLFKEAQHLFGNAIYTYYFDIPFEVTVRRHSQRHISSFGEKQMRSWWKEKDTLVSSLRLSFLMS